MHDELKQMLARYPLNSAQDCNQAVREIIQEIALVGLWRAKFFECAAFYGGTALRILYGLDRFSEDLDFSLLKTDRDFSLTPYHDAIATELDTYGFKTSVENKQKNIDSQIESAFIKANTKREMIRIGIPKLGYGQLHIQATLKIKLEVDTDPPPEFSTESKMLMDPLPVAINTYTPHDLFSGKMHAVLCRTWQKRVKGRDWYDFVWFVRRGIPLNLTHLTVRMQQSGHLQPSEALTPALFTKILREKIATLDVENALQDIETFIRDRAVLSGWSQDYFRSFAEKIKFL